MILRNTAVASAALLIGLLTTANAAERFTSYDTALNWARVHNRRPVLIAFQRGGQPAFPSEEFAAELDQLALLEIPTDYEHQGSRLIENAAFADLGAKPGFVRGEFMGGQLRITATLVGTTYDASRFKTKILKIALPDPLGYTPIMSAASIDAVKRLLPTVDDAKLTQILDDPHTMWYDDATMPSAYQDAVPPFTGILATRLSGNVAPIEFFQNGKFRFPFGDPGGLHRAVGVVGVNFLRLPSDGSKHLPVVWWKEGNSYSWSFPIGTVVGEVLMQRTPKGRKIVFEIRVRRRQRNNWHADAYRPFPTADSLAAAVMEYDSCWNQNPRLGRLVRHLRDRKTLRPQVLRDTYGAFSARGSTDLLPPIDAKMVTQLLRNATFCSSEGKAWKSQGKLECFSPTASTYSIVPVRYDAGLIAVHEISCNRCHQHTGKMIGEFVPEQQLYGQIWGSDGTFSWHPFDPGQLLSSPDGMSANPFRPAFERRHVIEAYSTAKHSAKFYNVIPEQRRVPRFNISF